LKKNGEPKQTLRAKFKPFFFFSPHSFHTYNRLLLPLLVRRRRARGVRRGFEVRNSPAERRPELARVASRQRMDCASSDQSVVSASKSQASPKV
jgi:hypothetical protein